MSKKTEGKLSAWKQTRQRQDEHGPADWSAINGKLIADCIHAIGSKGGALRMGYTRDGGAYAIGVYLDGDQTTEYVRPSEDLEGWLREFKDSMGAL